MRFFISNINTTTTPVVDEDEFSINNFAETTLVTPTSGDLNAEGLPIFNMYAGQARVQDRIYVSFRKCTGHDPYDGVVWMAYSDDEGETWSTEQMIYDPSHIFTDDPQILIDDPKSLLDARDTRLMVSPDGNSLLMFCFVSIGWNDAGTGPGTGVVGVGRNNAATTNPWRSMAVSYPIINGNEIDVPNKNIAYVVEGFKPFSGGYLGLSNGDILYSCYHNYGALTERGNWIYKSTDQGITWNYFSRVGRGSYYGEWGSDETSWTLLDNDDIIVVSRSNDGNPIFKSSDGGLTWSQSAVRTPYYSAGLNCELMPDGYVAVFGRAYPDIFLIDTDTLEYVVDSEFHFSSSGYGTLIKYMDKWTLAYMSSDRILFKQFQYDSINHKFKYNVQGTALNTSNLYSLIFSAINGLDLTLNLRFFPYDDYSDKYMMTWKVYNNGVLFAELGTHFKDDNVTISGTNVYLTFSIEYDIDYSFTITNIDDDGVESSPCNPLVYRLDTP